MQGADTSTPLLVHAGDLYVGRVEDLPGSALVVGDGGELLCKVEKQITFWPWRDGSTVVTSTAVSGTGQKVAPGTAGSPPSSAAPPPPENGIGAPDRAPRPEAGTQGRS